MIQDLFFQIAQLLIAAASAAFGGDILAAFIEILRGIVSADA